MPRKLSILLLSLLCAAWVRAWPDRASAQPEGSALDLQVTLLHVNVNAEPGSAREIVFRGRLDGYRRFPDDEIRNLACLYAAQPGAGLPKVYDPASVRIAVGNIGPEGEFWIRVPLCSIQRAPLRGSDLKVRFVGPVGLGDRPEAIFQADLLGVDEVDLRRLPELSEPIRKVNAAPSVLDANYDALQTLRACNAVIRMGKQRALLVLRAYTDIAAMPYIWDELPLRPESLDASDQRRVIELLHLACEPRAPAKELLRACADETRTIALGEREWLHFSPAQGDHPLWYLGMVYAKCSNPAQYPGSDYPFVIEGDVPFYLPELMNGRTGYDSTPGPYLTFFERYGELRERGVYRPSGTLLEILEGVIQRVPARKQELCDQALALLPRELDGVPPAVRKCAEELRARECSPVHLAPQDCEALLEWLRRTPLAWDQESEEFVRK
jgi:hypothetical protein